MRINQESSQNQIAKYTNQPNLVSQMNGVVPFNIKQTKINIQRHEMETEAREHLNLAHYNFNKMAVIDEEENDFIQRARSKDGSRAHKQIISNQSNEIKNMHNTTTGFYP